ncbi:MAG: PilZ domain-containing protein [Deltaproteobacteria bacterium]|nr:PilZ domain-containing protein [Deltaproteobacteria bacterium]
MSDEGADKVGEKAVEPTGRDRRSSQRVPVTMWVEEINDGTQVFRRAGNLSAGGMYLDKTIPMPMGTIVNLKFTLPGQTEPLQLGGTIVSIDPDLELGMGVKFTAIDDASRLRIEKYLAAAGE